MARSSLRGVDKSDQIVEIDGGIALELERMPCRLVGGRSRVRPVQVVDESRRLLVIDDPFVPRQEKMDGYGLALSEFGDGFVHAPRSQVKSRRALAKCQRVVVDECLPRRIGGEEFRIVKMTTASEEVSLKRTLTAHEVIELQNIVRRVPCADQVIRYAMRLVRATRVDKGDVETFVKDYVAWGAGPRASQNLVLAGKARALLHGRFHVSADDIRAVAYPVLRHRVLLSFNAEAEGITSDAIIHRLIESIASDSPGAMDDAMTKRVFAGESSDP